VSGWLERAVCRNTGKTVETYMRRYTMTAVDCILRHPDRSAELTSTTGR